MGPSGERHDGPLKVNKTKGSNKIPSSKSSSSEEAWEDLDEKLAAKLAELAVTSENLCIVQSCLKELQRAVSMLTPGWSVRPFGSSANGFATRGSDLDATCCRVGFQPGRGTPLGVVELQEELLKVLEAHSKFKVVENVRAARVPILRMKFEQTLDVDLSFQNVEPLPNTQLLRAYAALDPHVRDLVVLVKLWAKSAGVAGAQTGHLSPYALTLMAIYFLQVNPSSHMPCLNTAAFNGDAGIPAQARPSWSYSGSLSRLLARFFQFFTEEFKWGKEVVSVRIGQRSMAKEAVFNQLRGRMSARLHIEDPFLPARNLHCALKFQNEGALFAKLWEAMHATRRGSVPTGLPSAEPEREPAAPELKRLDSVEKAKEGEAANANIHNADGGEPTQEAIGSPKLEVGASERETSSTVAVSRGEFGCNSVEEESDFSGTDRGQEELADSPFGFDVTRNEEVLVSERPTMGSGPPPEEVPLTLLQGTWRL